MSSVPPSDLSRYLHADEWEIQVRDKWGEPTGDFHLITQPPELVTGVTLPDDTLHTVSQGDTLWTLAARYFAGIRRPCGLYWVIGHYQSPPIRDPLMPLPVGRVIRIPSRRTLHEVILSNIRQEMSLDMIAQDINR